MTVVAYSIDTLGLPQGMSNIVVTAEIAGAGIDGLVGSSSQFGKPIASTNGLHKMYVLRSADYLYAIIDYSGSSKPVGVATQAGKRTNMSSAQLTQLFPFEDSLSVAQGQVASLKTAMLFLSTM